MPQSSKVMSSIDVKPRDNCVRLPIHIHTYQDFIEVCEQDYVPEFIEMISDNHVGSGQVPDTFDSTDPVLEEATISKVRLKSELQEKNTFPGKHENFCESDIVERKNSRRGPVLNCVQLLL